MTLHVGPPRSSRLKPGFPEGEADAAWYSVPPETAAHGRSAIAGSPESSPSGPRRPRAFWKQSLAGAGIGRGMDGRLSLSGPATGSGRSTDCSRIFTFRGRRSFFLFRRSREETTRGGVRRRHPGRVPVLQLRRRDAGALRISSEFVAGSSEKRPLNPELRTQTRRGR